MNGSIFSAIAASVVRVFKRGRLRRCGIKEWIPKDQLQLRLHAALAVERLGTFSKVRIMKLDRKRSVASWETKRRFIATLGKAAK